MAFVINENKTFSLIKHATLSQVNEILIVSQATYIYDFDLSQLGLTDISSQILGIPKITFNTSGVIKLGISSWTYGESDAPEMLRVFAHNHGSSSVSANSATLTVTISYIAG